MLDESLFKSSLSNNPRIRNMRKQNASRHVSRANRVSNASLKIYHRCFLVFQLNRARASNNSLKLSLSLSQKLDGIKRIFNEAFPYHRLHNLKANRKIYKNNTRDGILLSLKTLIRITSDRSRGRSL